MKTPPFETVYFNQGEIYKASSWEELKTNYIEAPGTDELYPRIKITGKRYFMVNEFKQLFGVDDGITLSDFDLCPAVKQWLCLGAVSEAERKNYDLFFAFESTEQLQQVAMYYSLPFPTTLEMSRAIEGSPGSFSFMLAAGRPIVVCGIKYANSKPSILKLYTHPRNSNSWEIWMSGASYYNEGTCFESGNVYLKPTSGEVISGAHMRRERLIKKAEVIHTTKEDGTQTIYDYVYNRDPILFWQGREIDADRNTVRVKQYESSRYLRGIVGGMTDGPEYKEFDLCGDVAFWLGRSWYDGEAEQELLFAVTGGSAQLDAVAAYYKLPFPCTTEQRNVLDFTPEVYRARHLDMYKLGLGKYAPVIVASITFSNGLPTRFLFYTLMRQWDFTEQIELPNPVGITLAQTYLAGCVPIEESSP